MIPQSESTRTRRARALALAGAIATSAIALSACSSTLPSADAAPAGLDVQVEVPDEGESVTIDRIREQGTLRAGVISPGSAPFALQDPLTSEWYGPAPDLVTALAGELGVEVEWIEADWDTIVAGLQADKYDIAATALYATPERQEVVDFVTYAQAGGCYAVRRDDERVQSLDDLDSADLTVLVPSGSSYVTQFPEKYPSADVVSKPLTTGASGFYSEVVSGRYDVTPIENVLAKVIEQQQPDLRIVPDVDTCLTEPDLPQDVGLAVRKEDPVFLGVLQDVATQARDAVDAAVIEYSSPEENAEE